MAACNIKMLVSGYQSINMHCIVLPIKFDDGLSISVLRNKQLYKKMEVKSSHFQKVLICTDDHDVQEDFYTRLGAHGGTPPLLSHLATFNLL
jgi:hypothetical protein